MHASPYQGAACWLKRFPLSVSLPPVCKISTKKKEKKKAVQLWPDGLPIGWQRLQRRDDQCGEARRGTAETWRGGRVKLIPAACGLPGTTPICIYRMKIAPVRLRAAVTRFQFMNRGARCSRTRLKEADFLVPWVLGAHSSRPPFLLLRSFFGGTSLFASISTCTSKWVSF